MFGRVISESEHCARIRTAGEHRRLLWVLCVFACSGCALPGGARSAVNSPSRAPMVVNSTSTGAAVSRQTSPPQAFTPVRANAHPGTQTIRPTADLGSTAEVEAEFLPPQTPEVSRGSVPLSAPPSDAHFAEVPGGYWIVSSRQARVSPQDIDASRELVYLYRTPQTMRAFPREVFLQTLRPDRPTCITIHGSYNYWPDVLSESVHALRWVNQAAQGCEVQFVYFSWPADGYAHLVFPLELVAMGRRASRHSLYLANLLTQFPAEQPICLVGHSHGARCSVAALHALGGGSLEDGSRLAPGLGVPRRMNAVLLAAAVDHDWLNPGERYGAALPVTEQLLVMQNERDGWLRAYPLKDLLGNRQALGRAGFQEGDTLRMSDQIGKVSVLDASPFAGRSHDFRAFHSRAELAAAMTPFILFRSEGEPPLDARREISSRPSPARTTVSPLNARDVSRGNGLAPPDPNATRQTNSVPVSGTAASAARARGMPPGGASPRRPARNPLPNTLPAPR